MEKSSDTFDELRSWQIVETLTISTVKKNVHLADLKTKILREGGEKNSKVASTVQWKNLGPKFAPQQP